MNFLHIKNSVPKQTDFWGNGAIYHCFAEEPDEDGRQYSADLAELEADRAAALGLKVVRAFTAGTLTSRKPATGIGKMTVCRGYING